MTKNPLNSEESVTAEEDPDVSPYLREITELRQRLAKMEDLESQYKKLAASYAREQQQRRLSDALLSVGQIVTSTLELRHVLGVILGQLELVLTYHRAIVLLVEGDHLRFVAGRDVDGNPVIPITLPIARYSLNAIVLDTHLPLLIPDVSQEPRWSTDGEMADVGSFINVPLLVQGDPIGVLGVGRRDAIAYTEEDVDTVFAFATQVAIAVHNAQSYAVLQEQTQRLDLLHQVSLAVNASLDLKTILTAGCRMLVEHFSTCDHSAVLRYDLGDVYGEVVAEYPDRGAVGVHIEVQGSASSEYVARELQPLAIFDAQHDPMTELAWEGLRAVGVRSMLIVPLVAKDHLFGTIGLDAIQTMHEFTSEETELARTIALQMASAMENARLYMAVQQELTERRRAEATLQQSEENFRRLFSASPFPVALTRMHDGTVVMVNQAAIAFLEIAPDEVQTVRSLDFYANPDDRAQVLSELASRGQMSSFPLELLTRTGRRRWGLMNIVPLEYHDEPVYIVSWADITNQRRVQQELRKLSLAVEQSPGTVVITDTDGNIEYANPKFTQLTGYALAEVKGHNPRLLKSGEHSEAYYRNLWETIVARHVWRGELLNRKKNGEPYWELASISPIYDDTGELTHFVKVAEDITERKRTEEALHQYTLELEKSNAELDAFAHTVAHDLKTPLTSLSGFGALLEQRYARMSPERIQQTLGIITQTANKMTSIVDELLFLSSVRKMDDVQIGVLDMSTIVEEALGRLSLTLSESGAHIVVSKSWPAVLGYAPWVEEVWVNYLSNAIKYGGRSGAAIPPRIELGYSAMDDGRTVRFWVDDNGMGLSAAEQARLFAEFTRLDRIRVEGHGLGLSIVRRIVEKLGGEVGVESRVGEGSRFWFSLAGPDS